MDNENMTHLHSGILFSCEIMKFASKAENSYRYCEGTQTQKDEHHIFTLKCGSSVSLLIFRYVCLNRSTCRSEETKNAPHGSEI